jgi:hypothetical protein
MMTKSTWRYQCLIATAIAVAAINADANGGKFFPDDPVSAIVDSRDASLVQEREIDLVYDTLENSFSRPGDPTPNVRAQNLNTIDDVPDSSWFANRLGVVPVTVDELVKGPGLEISATGGPDSRARPAHAYFRRQADGWKLVGFERVPGGNAPASKGAKPRT